MENLSLLFPLFRLHKTSQISRIFYVFLIFLYLHQNFTSTLLLSILFLIPQNSSQTAQYFFSFLIIFIVGFAPTSLPLIISFDVLPPALLLLHCPRVNTALAYILHLRGLSLLMRRLLGILPTFRSLRSLRSLSLRSLRSFSLRSLRSLLTSAPCDSIY